MKLYSYDYKVERCVTYKKIALPFLVSELLPIEELCFYTILLYAIT